MLETDILMQYVPSNIFNKISKIIRLSLLF
jgi:hypothetical protein